MSRNVPKIGVGMIGQSHEEAVKSPWAMVPETLYNAFFGVNHVCFGGELFPLVILWIPDSWHEDGVVGGFFPDRLYLLFREDFVEDVGVESDAFLNVMHHELVHVKGYLRGIRDCDGQRYHNMRFRESVERYGGFCAYEDDRWGWSRSRMTPETVAAVRERYDYMNV